MLKGNIRPISSSDAEMILSWRNQEPIRLNMYNHEIIDIETHLKWFNKILVDTTCQYFIYMQNEVPMGLLSFSNIDFYNKRAFWAFYSADVSRRGIGSEMEKLALDYAFNELALNKLCCEVLEFNYPVVNFHRKFGFEIEGLQQKHYRRNNSFYDIYQLSITRENYLLMRDSTTPKLSKSYSWEFIAECEGTLNNTQVFIREISNAICSISIALVTSLEISKFSCSPLPFMKSPLTGRLVLKTQIDDLFIYEAIIEDLDLVRVGHGEFVFKIQKD